jgi:hypothetical protein
VQALRFELHHDSALAQLLLRRGLACPSRVGHVLFWQLRSLLCSAHLRCRYSLLLEAYCRALGSAPRKELLAQVKAMEILKEIGSAVQLLRGADRVTELRARLAHAQFPETFVLPLDPRIVVSGFLTDKCKVIDAKRAPLWLVLRRLADADEQPFVTVVFRHVEERYSNTFSAALASQMMDVFERLWYAQGVGVRR